MTTVCVVDAGSVRFTQELVADILRCDEFAKARRRLHDIADDLLLTAHGHALPSWARAVSADTAIHEYSISPDRGDGR